MQYCPNCKSSKVRLLNKQVAVCDECNSLFTFAVGGVKPTKKDVVAALMQAGYSIGDIIDLMKPEDYQQRKYIRKVYHRLRKQGLPTKQEKVEVSPSEVAGSDKCSVEGEQFDIDKVKLDGPATLKAANTVAEALAELVNAIKGDIYNLMLSIYCLNKAVKKLTDQVAELNLKLAKGV